MADVFLSHLEWTGYNARPASSASFSRDLAVSIDGITMPVSAAPGYGGDPARANPEQLFVAALSACQALTYLFLAARSGVRVVGYTDDAEGQLGNDGGRMHMSQVTLRPRITLEPGSDEARALALVEKAHEQCFIGNSVSTQVQLVPTVAFDNTALATTAHTTQ